MNEEFVQNTLVPLMLLLGFIMGLLVGLQLS